MRFAIIVRDKATQIGKPLVTVSVDQQLQPSDVTCGTNAVKQPRELMMAPLAVSNPEWCVLNQAPHIIIEIANNDKA
jgi:hypothetical protein